MFWLSGAITKKIGVNGVLTWSFSSYVLRFIIYASIKNAWQVRTFLFISWGIVVVSLSSLVTHRIATESPFTCDLLFFIYLLLTHVQSHPPPQLRLFTAFNPIWLLYLHTYTYTHTYPHSHAHTLVTHTYTHTHTHTYTQSHTHSHVLLPLYHPYIRLFRRRYCAALLLPCSGRGPRTLCTQCHPRH